METSSVSSTHTSILVPHVSKRRKKIWGEICEMFLARSSVDSTNCGDMSTITVTCIGKKVNLELV